MQGFSEFAQFQGLEAILTHLIPFRRRLEVACQVSIWEEIATQYQIETEPTERVKKSLLAFQLPDYLYLKYYN